MHDLLQPSQYRHQHRFDILQNLMIPEAHHSEALALQIAGPMRIVRTAMLAPIQLHDQPGLSTDQITNERTD